MTDIHQQLLDSEQISEFYHSFFVEQQVDHFTRLVAPKDIGHQSIVVDVGGGCGHFARALQERMNVPVRVIDSDPVSVKAAREAGLEAECGDALKIRYTGDEAVTCFNLILHHLVGSSESETRKLQVGALEAWRGSNAEIFVNEYIYDSLFGDVSARVIYAVTRSKLLSAIGTAVSKIVPSLRANTFGVGVRFRSRDEWRRIFQSLGLRIVAEVEGEREAVSLPRRILLIKSIRRDSFLLSYTPAA